MLFQICPHKVTEKKSVNFSKLQSLNALKNLSLLFSFFLHDKQLPSQIFVFLLFRLLFTLANIKGKIRTISE